MILTLNPSTSSVAFTFKRYQNLTLLTTSMATIISKLDLCNILTSLPASTMSQPCPAVKSPHSSQSDLRQDTYILNCVTFLFIKSRWCWISLGVQSGYFPQPSWPHFYLRLWTHLSHYASLTLLYLIGLHAYRYVRFIPTLELCVCVCGSLCLQLSPLQPFNDSLSLLLFIPWPKYCLFREASLTTPKPHCHSSSQFLSLAFKKSHYLKFHYTCMHFLTYCPRLH